MALSQNPFPNDPDRSAIWTMLVPRDIEAYVKADWSMVEDDFVTTDFFGVNGNGKDNPDGWTISYPTLDLYRDEWLRQAREGQSVEYAEDQEAGIHRATSLTEIEITGERASSMVKSNAPMAALIASTGRRSISAARSKGSGS
jgi:hypothetical protein